MITNVYLKSESKKVIPYPDCYPVITVLIDNYREINICPNKLSDSKVATYMYDSISRIEFKP